MTTALNVLKAATALIDEIEYSSEGLSFIQFIREYRTIDLRLPRRSGKTLAANWLKRNKSCLEFSKYKTTNVPGFDYYSLMNRYRGRRGDGMKFQCIVLDEYSEWPEGFEEFLVTLKLSDLLTHDFFVVSLYT